MHYPVPTLRACAEAAIPGCIFYHGLREEGNVDFDHLRLTDTIVMVEDKMLVSFTKGKYGNRTGTVFQATVSVMAYGEMTDEPAVRLARMNELLAAAEALLLKLEQHKDLAEVTSRTIVTAYNQFDGNCDGVVMQLDLTPAERPNLC